MLTNSPLAPVAPPGTAAPSSTLGGTTYTVTAGYTENLVNTVGQTIGQSDLCSAGQPPSPSHPGVIGLQVIVTWDGGRQLGGQHTVSVTTEINYPKPGLQTEGFLAINLANDGQTDINGNLASDRLQALPVSITQLTGIPGASRRTRTRCTRTPTAASSPRSPSGPTTSPSASRPRARPSSFNGYNGAPPFVNTSGSTTDAKNNQTVAVTAESVVQLDAFDEGINANVNYGGPSAVDGGVSCPNAASITCIALGDGTSGASTAWGGAGSTWSSTVAGRRDLAQPGRLHDAARPPTASASATAPAVRSS